MKIGSSVSSSIPQFAESLRDPEKFLKYCKEFHEIEPRNMAYAAAWGIISRDPDDIGCIRVGSITILSSWNAMNIMRRPYEERAGLDKDVLNAYKNSRDKLDKIKGKKLYSLDLNDEKIAENIKEIFSEFSSRKTIGKTGASKVLHLLNPDVFMMWDDKIMKEYHKEHKNHKRGTPECYLEFLRQSQQIIGDILSKREEEELWNEHLKFLDKDIVNLMNALSFRESMTKMLDECNYIRFTRNRIL
jgi:exonuclease I